jgi:tRNA(adenine34) deaminase
MENFEDNFYMQMAIREAEKAAQEGEIPVGAILVARGRVLAKTHNQTERLRDVTAHAEMLSISAVSAHKGVKFLNSCTLYVTLEPCPMCMGALYWAQLGRLVFGASDSKRGYRVIAPALAHSKTEIHSGVCAQEAEQLMKDFFKKLRS